MGAAARLLKEIKWEVEGGDVSFDPPMGPYLKSLGIPLHFLPDIEDDHLRSFDFIVVGNVVSGKSKDARRLEGLGVELISFPALLKKFVLFDKKVVGVAGTHGKTTTTFFLTQIFTRLGANPGYFIGGVLEKMPSAHLGKGDYFFIEADEYDSSYFSKVAKFRLYNIYDLILTSLEFDHGDIFSSLEDIKDQFRHLLTSLKGSCIFCSDYSASFSLKKEFSHLSWIDYGKKSSLGPTHIESREKFQFL